MECGVTVDSQPAAHFDLQSIPARRIADASAIEAGRRRAQLLAACESLAIAQAVFDATKQHLAGRKQFGQPIAEFQLVQAMLADSQAEIYAARCMVIDAARKRDEGRNVSTEASCSKMFASEMCGRVADRAVQIFGGSGYVADHGIERFYRDVRLFRLYEGTTQIQQIVIARNMVREATR